MNFPPGKERRMKTRCPSPLNGLIGFTLMFVGITAFEILAGAAPHIPRVALLIPKLVVCSVPTIVLLARESWEIHPLWLVYYNVYWMLSSAVLLVLLTRLMG